MSALDSGTLGTEIVTDLGEIAKARAAYLREYGYRLPLQDAERQAGLTTVDIWQFADEGERGLYAAEGTQPPPDV